MKRRYSWPLRTTAALVVLLIAVNIALPYLVRDYLNDKLADMGDYRGEITDVDWHCGEGRTGSGPEDRQDRWQGPGALL